ncbi:hypothetical protein SLA2020_165190 [Shorea laevis]
MELVKKMETSHWWWLESQSASKRSPWLQSTLSELDSKTKAMLKLIEEDADSFAQRAEMYYKKRPELITMVEDFYRAHRSLAERHDQLKSDGGSRFLTTLGFPFSPFKYPSQKSTATMDQTSDSCSETFDAEDDAESEVEDPEEDERYERTQINTGIKQVENPVKGEEKQTHIVAEEGGDTEEEDGTVFDQETGEVISSGECNVELMKLREEVERLKEENKFQKAQLMEKDEEKSKVLSELYNSEVMKLRIEVERLKEENKVQKVQLMEKDEEKSKVLIDLCNVEVMKLREEVQRLKEVDQTQKAQLMQKDEEKREVIRQLSLAIQVLKDQNMDLRKCVTRDSPRKWNPFDLSKLNGGFFGKLLNGSPKVQATVVAL